MNIKNEIKGKEKGILKLEPRQRVPTETRSQLTPQGSWDRPPASPQPSVDRLSVTWAEPEDSMTSSVNLFHLSSETPINNESRFPHSPGDVSEDEDYSASLSAVLRQRRASVRRSRKGRGRRPSSPFLQDEPRRRRSSVYTTSSGDTAISIDEGQATTITQEQIFENIHLHKEVLGSVKQQPLGMRRKLKIVHQAKTYIKRHEGQLQERLAQSKRTKDIYARFTILIAAKWQSLKREAANMSNLLIPWELRIKEIESHFGSVVASYFTFLRWLFWVNLVIGFILMVFVIVPEYLTAYPNQDVERQSIIHEESRNASNLLALWEFEGVLKYSPIFYGYYTNVERPEYRMPLAYFLTGFAVYIYSFVATLRKMAENSRMSKLSEKEDECIFSWKLFTGWDFMIGNAETAHNRIASVILGFKEALLEEAEKKKDLRNWRIISLRAFVNVCVVILLFVSAYAVVKVVSRSDDSPKIHDWWRENETTIVVTVISITFPVFFELLGLLEHYHPRKQLRLQLARIMLLNLLNLYSLIFALFSKIEGMSAELDSLKPPLSVNVNILQESAINYNESFGSSTSDLCTEIEIPCSPCQIIVPPDTTISVVSTPMTDFTKPTMPTLQTMYISTPNKELNLPTDVQILSLLTYAKKDIDHTNKNLLLSIENLKGENSLSVSTNSLSEVTSSPATERLLQDELNRLRSIVNQSSQRGEINESSVETNDYDDYLYDLSNNTTNTTNFPMDDVINLSVTQVYDEASNVTNVSSSWQTDNITIDIIDSFYEENETLSDDVTESSVIDTTENKINEYFFANVSTLESFVNKSKVTKNVNDDHNLLPLNNNNSTVSNNMLLFCPDIEFNCTITCGKDNITQKYTIKNCSTVLKTCFVKRCKIGETGSSKFNKTNITEIDFVYFDEKNRKVYNLTETTKKKLSYLCWETMFGQELIKLTMMDLVFVLLGTLFMDFFRSLFVRYMNRCWCWNLEKKFPEYGDFKIAENILHLINNQGMVWMGMFFSPGLVVLNIFKLVIMMYLRSWAVMTCNVPHEVVFRVSKSNNFYLALLLTMLFLCVLPVGYSIVWVKPSWHCGPFSEYDKIYHILTNNIDKILPKSLNFTLEYMASPAIVIPLLVLLILIIYYLTSLTNSLREANNDLKIQLRRERTEERRKMFQLADKRRRVGSSDMDNTPFARWKRALPHLSKSIESDDRKVAEDESQEPKKYKKKGGIFAKIVSLALDRKSDIKADSEDYDRSPSTNVDDETDTDFHENLPKELLQMKDVTALIQNKQNDDNKKIDIENNVRSCDIVKEDINDKSKTHKTRSATKPALSDILDCQKTNLGETLQTIEERKSTDSISSVIPVITISATESDDELLQPKSDKSDQSDSDDNKSNSNDEKTSNKNKVHNVDTKLLKRQTSVDSASKNNN